MIHSFFFVSATGEVLIEKHWRAVTPRAILMHFLEQADSHSANKEEVPPILHHAGSYIFSVLRGGNFLVATTTQEITPLLVSLPFPPLSSASVPCLLEPFFITPVNSYKNLTLST